MPWKGPKISQLYIPSVDGKWEFKHILEKKPKAVIFWGFFITHFSTKAAPPNFPSFSEEPHHPHQTPEESHFAQN